MMMKHAMDRIARRIVVLGIVLLLATLEAGAVFKSEAMIVPDFAARVRTVAIAPLECPPDVDCAAVEEHLAVQLETDAGLTVVRAADLRNRAFGAGIDLDSNDALPRVFELDGIEGLVVVELPGIIVKTQRVNGSFDGTFFSVAPHERKSGEARLWIFDRDGRKLLDGRAWGTSQNALRTGKGFSMKLLRGIVEEAFR